MHTRPRGYKTFSCAVQMNTKFQLLIKTKIPTNEEVSCFKSLRCCIYHANKCSCSAELNMKKIITSGPATVGNLNVTPHTMKRKVEKSIKRDMFVY